MKNILPLFMFLLASIYSMAQKTLVQLQAEATTIRDEKTPSANTAARVGQTILDFANSLVPVIDYAVATGTNAYSATVNSVVTQYVHGQLFRIEFQNANTGSSTLNINGLGSVLLTSDGSTALVSGAIKAGQQFNIYYNGTAFQLNGGSGGASSLATLTDANISTPLNNQLLQYQTSDNKWHNSSSPFTLTNGNFIVGNSSSIATGVSMSGDATLINTGAVSVNKILGNTIPVNGTGALYNNGSGTLSWSTAFDITGGSAKWTTGRTLSITGDMAYTSPSFDGTGNVTADGTLATVNSNVGTFGSSTQSLTATVNAKGLITALSQQTVTPAVGSITGLGAGVGTWLATPSWTNFNSAITGTAPYWGLASGGTLTGANVVTGTTSNTLQLQFNSLNNIVTRGAGIWLKNSTNAVSGTQQDGPSFISEGTAFNVTSGLPEVTTFAFRTKGVQQGSGSPLARLMFSSSVNGSAFSDLFYFESTGTLGIGSTTISGVTNTIAFTQTGVLQYAVSTNPNPNGAIKINSAFALANTTSAIAELGIGSTFSPSSGTGAYNGLLINPTINQTSTASGNVVYFDIKPTRTSVLGQEYVFLGHTNTIFTGLGTASPIATLHNAGSTASHTVTSSTGTLTLDKTATWWIFTGSTSTWTLPPLVGNTDLVYSIYNRGSGNLTVQRAGSDNLYQSGSVTSITVATGTSAQIINDGSFWLVK